jgi:hypothetical protein
MSSGSSARAVSAAINPIPIDDWAQTTRIRRLLVISEIMAKSCMSENYVREVDPQ